MTRKKANTFNSITFTESQSVIRIVLAVIFSIALSGCKIQLISSDGGTITTLSGSYTCIPQQDCPPIDVNDLFFNETFMAKPSPGYTFSGWKIRDRGLCGGSKNDCHLFTSGFTGNSALLSFLEKKDVFYLEAQFEQTNQSTPLKASEGLWLGKTNENRGIQGLILSDGSYYLIYSAPGQFQSISGVMIGHSNMSGNILNSTDAQDFNIDGVSVRYASVNATVNSQKSITGKIIYTDGAQGSFSATYSSDYEITPSLQRLTGSYSGKVAFSQGFESATFNVAANGKILGSGQSGCQLTGQASTRQTGNVYDIEIKFGGTPCFYANQTFNGIIYLDKNTGTIYAIAPHKSRTDGFLFVGA